jgi:hypothetical protein
VVGRLEPGPVEQVIRRRVLEHVVEVSSRRETGRGVGGGAGEGLGVPPLSRQRLGLLVVDQKGDLDRLPLTGPCSDGQAAAAQDSPPRSPKRTLCRSLPMDRKLDETPLEEDLDRVMPSEHTPDEPYSAHDEGAPGTDAGLPARAPPIGFALSAKRHWPVTTGEATGQELQGATSTPPVHGCQANAQASPRVRGAAQRPPSGRGAGTIPAGAESSRRTSTSPPQRRDHPCGHRDGPPVDLLPAPAGMVRQPVLRPRTPQRTPVRPPPGGPSRTAQLRRPDRLDSGHTVSRPEPAS